MGRKGLPETADARERLEWGIRSGEEDQVRRTQDVRVETFLERTGQAKIAERAASNRHTP